MKLTCPNRCRIYFARGMYLYLAILILLVPLRWLFAMCIGAAVHELLHILALKLFRIHIYSIKIGPMGAAIHTQMISHQQELICALAGPIGALSLLLFVKWIPMIALCVFFQSLYNLLPIYPFDGGRALHCIFHMLLPERYADVSFDVFQKILLGTIFVAALYAAFRYHLGILPILLAGFPVLGNKVNKNSLQR